MTPPTTTSARFAGLDGLRAVAVLLVLVYHLFPGAGLRSGFVGVDVFFVISGFLITSLLLRPARPGSTRTARLKGFWRRRARRLLPALAVVVTASATAAWLIGGDVLVGIGRQVLGAATFSYNWLSIAAGADYFAATGPELFRNMWSLAVEEQFYLLWPLLLPLVLLIRPRLVRIAIVGAAAGASACWMAVVVGSGGVTRAYFGTDTHAFGLLLGIALAFLVAGGRGRMPRAGVRALSVPAGLIGVVAVVAAAVLPQTPDAATFPGALLLASVGTALIIAAGAVRESGFGRALDVAPLRWIGDRSYGIYLWHWPLLVLAMAATRGTGPESGVPAVTGIVVAVLSLVLAAASYRLVELPIRRLGFRRSLGRLGARLTGSPSTRLSGLTALAVAVLAIGGTTAAVAAAPAMTSAEQAIAAGADAVADAAASSAAAEPAPQPRTITGDEVTAIGDSVMLASAPSLYDALPGIAVDAEVSRPMRVGPDLIHDLAVSGALRPYVVVALGTNGAIETAQLQRMLDGIGPQRQLILVTAYAPRDWITGVNRTLESFARRHPRVSIADWSAAIAPHEELLAGDRIHPGRPGGDIFAQAVRDALDRTERDRVREEERRARAGEDDRISRVPFPG